MVRPFFLFCFFFVSVFFLVPAHAGESCSRPSLLPAFANSEREFEEQAYFSYKEIDDPRQQDSDADSAAWLQKVAAYNLPPLPSRAEADLSDEPACNFDTAIEVLSEIAAQLGENHPYLRQWAENQHRVLSSCLSGKRLVLAEFAKGAPPRAVDDLAYQKLALRFYTRSEEDLPDLEKDFLVEAMKSESPMQGRAATMALRLAMMNEGLGHLMDVAERLRHNPATAKAYAYAEDTIFTAYWNYSVEPTDPAELEQRLRWLADAVLEKNVPLYSREASVQQNYREWRRRDARYQLRQLVRSGSFNSKDLTPGWWLGQAEETDPYRESVRRLAAAEPYIDYIAVRQIETPLSSWRWALYDADSVVWHQSQVVSDHAFSRFCKGEGVEWLLEAARLSPPQNPKTKDIRVCTQ
jgi:hypothetical protein